MKIFSEGIMVLEKKVQKKKKEEENIKPATVKKPAVKKKKKDPAPPAKPKEPKATKGFFFIEKLGIKYEVPKVRVQATMIEGKAYCPVCGARNYRVEDVDIVDIPFTLVGKGTCNICSCRIEYLFSTKISERSTKVINAAIKAEPVKKQRKKKEK